MAEPVTTSIAAVSVGAFLWSTFGQGVAGNEAHRFYLLALDRWRNSPLDPATGLPRNHDLLLASRDALREAALVLTLEIAGQLDPQKPWIPAILDHVRQGKLFKIPLIEARNDPRRQWLEAFRVAVQSKAFDEGVHDRLVLNEDDVRACFAEGCDARFNERLGERLAEWAEAQITEGSPPPGFREALAQGWKISAGGARMSLGQGYCLFFREHLKHRPEVFNIYVADLLSELRAELKSVVHGRPDLAMFEQWLEPQLAEVVQLLVGLDKQLQALAGGQTQIAATQGEILVAVTFLATETQRGNRAAETTMAQLLVAVLDTRAGVELLLDDAAEKNKKLDLLLGRQRDRRRPPFHRLKRAQAGQFFGRQKLLAELTQRLAKGEDACVWGPAGMGKTALAAEAVHAVIENEASLAASPFPDGLVEINLYQFKADANKVWEHLATAFAPDLPANQTAEERATQACRGRRALIVVEGAEEAQGGDGLQKLLAVLAPENRRLILTRNKEQIFNAHALNLDVELSRDESLALLGKLTEELQINEQIFAGVHQRLGGHPLALTWAGSQLASAEESPAAFLSELQRANLPHLHEKGYEHHTLKWLYGRSVRHLTDDARRVLAAAGILAAAPFPLTAAAAVLEGEEVESRGRAALKLLVRHGLVRLSDGDGERWEFTHALASQFARPDDPGETTRLTALGDWALAEIAGGISRARQAADFFPLRIALLHAAALLKADASGECLKYLANYLLYSGQNTFVALGNLGLASAALQAVEQWMEAQPAGLQNTNDWQRERSGAWSRRGNVQSAEGDLGAARASFEECLRIAQKLAASDPANAERQRDLSVSFNKLGNVQLAEGDLGAARASFEEDLRIAQKLATSDPANAKWQRDLSVSFDKLGNVQLAERDLGAARASFEESLRIRQKLAASDPANALWQRDLSVSFNSLGGVQLAEGDLGAARASFEEDLRIAHKLAASDPANAGWQRDLALSHGRLGDMANTAGEPNAARQAFTAGLAIVERLVALDPVNATWRNDLAWFRARLEELG